ncbi:MAG: PAS domain-containing protein [Candidatus Methanoperedens sp.]
MREIGVFRIELSSSFLITPALAWAWITYTAAGTSADGEGCSNIRQSIVNTVQESILVLDKDMRVISANPSFYDTFHVSPEGTENKFIYDIGNGQWDIPRLRKLLEEILPGNSHFKMMNN